MTNVGVLRPHVEDDSGVVVHWDITTAENTLGVQEHHSLRVTFVTNAAAIRDSRLIREIIDLADM